MTQNMIYMISRQYGSGGRAIARKLAETLEIPFYDEELLNIAAQESGINKDLFESNDEKPTNSFLYALSLNALSTEAPLNSRLFVAQTETIQKLAQRGPCVFVGRCADYALKNMDNTVHAFIYADIDSRIKRVTEVYGEKMRDAKSSILRKDKQRANYYHFYTEKEWSSMESYEICLDSAAVGTDGVVQAIIAFGIEKEKMLKS